MFFEINASSTVPVYQQIKDQVKRSIASGLLAAEARLPSVRDLAVHLRLNPNTVARAFRELELEGVLYSRKGHGTFVSAAQPKVRRQERVREVAALMDALLLAAEQHALSDEEIRQLFEERLERRSSARKGEE